MAVSRPRPDRRWFKCRRPFIVSGGELSLDMLDLTYNAASKMYDAPLQLKANNGIYLIDDFGRQRCTPAEVLNRWIVPMERGSITYPRTGGKTYGPFEAFLVFSTNLRPDQLGDEAFLRRIGYKMHLKNPSKGEFLEIFRSFCDSRGLESPLIWQSGSSSCITGRLVSACAGATLAMSSPTHLIDPLSKAAAPINSGTVGPCVPKLLRRGERYGGLASF